MATIAYETPAGVTEETVSDLKYKDDTDCWWYYVDPDERGSNTAKYVPRERVFYVERGR